MESIEEIRKRFVLENQKDDLEDFKHEIIQVKDDVFFHDLFNDKDIEVVEWLVATSLKLDYNKVHNNLVISNIRLTRVRKGERNKYVDMLIFLEDQFVLIELNRNYSGNPIRNTIYLVSILAGLYDKEFQKKVEKYDYRKIYDQKPKGTLLNLNWYPEDSSKRHETEYKVETPCCFPPDSADKYLGEYLKTISINLDVLSKKCYNEISDEDKFYKLLTIKDKAELEEFTKDIPQLKNYVDKIEDLSKRKEQRDMLLNKRIEDNLTRMDQEYQMYAMGEARGKACGEAEGEARGIELGKQQEKAATIANLNAISVPIEVISKAVELPIEQVQAIISK